MINIILNRELEKPLYAQIRDAIVNALKNKELTPGEKLPTISVLSKELDVTPATIIRAFEDLTKEGYIISQVGRGTFINDRDDMDQRTQGAGSSRFSQSPLEPSDPEFALAARKLRMGIAGSLNSLNVLLNRPNLIHFTSGVPDPDIADPGLLERCAVDALKRGQKAYQGYIHPPGLKELREIIAERFCNHGTSITPEHVLITSGSQQAVSIIAQYALENKYRILCESPCYMGIPNAFGAIGHWVESLARDEFGPIPQKLSRFYDGKPSILYLCTLLHNPMGTDISPERAKMVKEWAIDQNSLIISDEIFHDLHFDENPPASLFEKFGPERTLVIGSISKSLMCGLRIGWIVAHPDKIRSLAGLKRAMDIGSPSLMQGIAVSIFESGEYDKHIEKARQHYKIRRDAVVSALEKYMPGEVKWTNAQGSMHMWVELPQGYSSIALFLLAVERGVAISPGPQMDIDHRFINGFKLSYGSTALPQIQEGIGLLADAVKTLLKNPPADPGLTGLGDFI